MRAALLLLVTAGCNWYSSSSGDDDSIDATGLCGGGICIDTCGGEPQPDEACTPGMVCEYQSWEHGCSCVCNPGGYWECRNETIGSRCATGEFSAFAEPLLIMSVASNLDEIAPSLSADGLTLMFARPGPGTDLDLWTATRADELAEFSAPVREAALASTDDDTEPALSADGLALIFTRGDQLVQSTRAARTDAWGAPAPIAELAGYSDADFSSQDLHLALGNLADGHLYETTRSSLSTAWSVPSLASTSGAVAEREPAVREDAREIFFIRNVGGRDEMFMAIRHDESPFDFSQSVPLAGFDMVDVRDPALSIDGTTLVFSANNTGDFDLYIAHRVRM